MPHAVLLGDSIFDNGAYVAGGTPVIAQLRSRLPSGWKTTLLARDGAQTVDVMRQVQQLPSDATHLVLSVGGNDALENTPIVRSPNPDSAALLVELADAQSRFRETYREMLRVIDKVRRPTVACTVYDAVPGLSEVERMALSVFNDVIVRELIAAHIPILDLRLVCVENRDFSAASPIEPSEIGGSKITRAIQRIVCNHDFNRSGSGNYP